MLVLSRRENQKVLFPNLGITVEIAGLNKKTVRLGIDAPPEIRILRAELYDEEVTVEPSPGSSKAEPNPLAAKHKLNNALNSIALKIQLAQKLLERSDNDQAMRLLGESLERLRELDSQCTNGPSSDAAVPNGKPKWRALLVEDDANERQLMASILRMCGFEVDTAPDGMAAIEYLKKHDRPDCVLMDMQMPTMSGPEAITAIREDVACYDVPIYGVSGMQRHEARVPLGDRGVSGWFSKPVDADEMLNRILADINRDQRTVESLSMN